MEVQVIDDAVCTKRVVAQSQGWLRAHFENLQQQLDELIGEHLREAVLSKEQQERVGLTQWVLIEQHRVGTLTDVLLAVVLILLLLHLLLGYDLFVVQVDVEQDLARVLFQ